MRKKSSKKAFTLTEIMIVIIILGIMASLAIPQYQKTLARAHEKDAVRNLTLLHAAEQIYRVQNGEYWPTSGTPTIADINSNLKLNIIESGMTYSCQPGATPGSTFTCEAVRQAPATVFTVRVTQAAISSTNPGCVVALGGCP